MKEPEASKSLAPGVLYFIRQHRLVSGQPILLVAVSGGQDSVCLLHILVELQEELKIKLQIAHLNHQLRGAESEADAEYVAHLAQQLGVPAIIERRDVKAYQAQQHLSLEEAAREVRYRFLAEVAKSLGTDRVAVAHTADDHIETMLMHLTRGTGTRGLRGLQPTSRWQSANSHLTIVRPLLPISRQETADYCRKHQLMIRVDTSNLSLSPLRNRIRHQLLPLLQSYNPQVTEALLRTAQIATDVEAFLDAESTRLWDTIARRQGDTIIFDKEEFLQLPSALQRHLLRQAIEGLLNSLKDIETRHIAAIMAALNKPAGKRLSLPGGLVFAIDYHQYYLGAEPVALAPFPLIGEKSILKIPGETSFSGWCVAASIIEPEDMENKRDNFTAYLDQDKVGNKVIVRCRQPGDNFQPLGLSQPKKLGEFMIDAKIPRAWRQRIPIVCSPRHILWVVGWRIDDRVKVTEDTRQVLRLQFKPTL